MDYGLGRRGLLTGALALGLAVGLGTAETAAAQDWPTEPVTMMVSTPAGGSIDRWSRALAPYLSEELGVPVVVENVGGGRGIMSHDRLLRSGGEGDLLLTSTISQLIDHIQAGRVAFGLDDFAYLNAPQDEYAIVIATSGTDIDTADGMVEALKGDGVPSMAGAPGTGPGILMGIFLEKLGIPAENYREVAYSGGGPLMAALQGGQIDLAPLPNRLFPALEGATPLMVFRDERTADFEGVPTANEVLAQYGESMPSMNTGLRAVLVPASLEEEHPDRYQTLVDALDRVYHRDDALKDFEAAQVGTAWLGPEKTRQAVDDFAENFGDYLGK